MKLRQLWQWPALFIAFVSLAGTVAVGPTASAAEPAVRATERGNVSERNADTVARAAVQSASRNVLGRLTACPASLRQARQAADCLDVTIATVMDGMPDVSARTVEALAVCAMIAEELRHPDKRVRSRARDRLRQLAGSMPPQA